MSKTFLKFKERQQRLRLIKSLAIGGAFGIGLGGLCLILAKLDLLGFAPIFSLPIALVIFAAAGALAYRALAQSDIALASELDARFDLKEKVQTMVAFDGEGGDMLALQRDDAERSLSQISPDQLKIEKIWIYITALSAALAILIGGIITPNIWKRNQNPPYKLTEYQEAGIKELINYVNSSEMEEEYRTKISAELTDLLSDLKGVDNEKAMRAELAESMALICAITYDSSNSAEILNTLWGTSDRYLRYLAKWLDTSSSYDEGDFAERLVEYSAILVGEEQEEEDSDNAPTDEEKKALIAGAVDGMVRKYKIAFDVAKIPENDEIYLALQSLFYSEAEGEEGLALVNDKMKDLDYQQAKDAVTAALYGVYDEMYAAIRQQKINTNTGEYAMTRLSSLFAVPIPEFERPGFVKTGEAVEGNNGTENEDDRENGNNNGGIGEGETFGSKDLVLDPLTGNYVEYGTLIETYYGVVNEKLESGSYTEEQKEMILKYFALLYSGIEE